MAPTCVVYIAATLDGFIARSDGKIDWLSTVERPGEDYGFAAFFATVDTLVMGRKTYDAVAAFPDWPFAGKRVVVMTHSPPTAKHGERFFAGDVRALYEELVRDGAERVYVDGGMALSQFVAAGLVSEVTVSVIPLLLGEGTRLTQPLGRDVKLALASTKAFESGLVQLRYLVVDR